jgi:peptidoglycan/LPS O-acetylase OafA/YrhL
MTDTGSLAPIGRFHSVDALRGIAALSIVVFHYHHFYLADAFDRPAMPVVDAFPYAGLLAPLYGPFAAKAVELFWLISGFVFAHVYLPRHASVWTFFVARFARLYPLHVATLLYVGALQAISLHTVGHWQIYGNNDLRHFGLQLFMSSNWITWSRGLSFNGPVWSVSLEIVVYALFFVSLFIMRRRPIWVSVSLCAICWTWVAIEPVTLPLVQTSVFLCAGYFFLGCLLYALRPDAGLERAVTLTVLSACVALLGVVAGVEDATVAAVAVALVSIAAGADRFAPSWGVRLSALGDISYSVYLVHVPLQMTALLVSDLAFGGSREWANSHVTLPVYFVCSVAMAFVAHHWLERPAGQAIRRALLLRRYA